jgi:AcrR family transcriptional regulator
MDRDERERLFGAMLSGLDRHGYEGLSVDLALAGAEVSRQQFDAEFGDKDGCLFAAYDALAERLLQRAASPCEGTDPWPRRVRAGLEGLLAELAAEPSLARALTKSFPSIRPATYRRYIEFLESFTPLLREGRSLAGNSAELPREMEMLAIGAAETIVVAEIDAGRAAQLPSMLQAILFSLLVPFVGPDEALAISREDGAR